MEVGTFAKTILLTNLQDMILNHRFSVIDQQNIQKTVGLHTIELIQSHLIIVADNVLGENTK